MTRARRRAGGAWVIAVVVALGLGWWAGRATFVPPRPVVVAERVPTYSVVEGTVGSTETYTARMSWPTTLLATAAGAGTVTTVDVHDGDMVASGDVLYTVGLRPVVIASGQVPAFRDLTSDVTGADVRQLEQLLVDKGFTTATPDEKFTTATAAAVKKWQKSLGVPVTGVVAVGDLVFADGLPARVVLDEAVRPGLVLAGGEKVASAATGAPTVTIAIDPSTRSTVPRTGMAVRVIGPGVVWDAVVGDMTSSEAKIGNGGELTLTLTAPDGGPVCAAPCAAVPFTTADVRFDATVVVRPEVTGAMVPLSALSTAADGSAFVLTSDGERRTVKVLASDGSRSVVEGLSAGEVVALFGSPGHAVSSPRVAAHGDAASPTPSTAP